MLQAEALLARGREKAGLDSVAAVVILDDFFAEEGKGAERVVPSVHVLEQVSAANARENAAALAARAQPAAAPPPVSPKAAVDRNNRRLMRYMDE